ncbi:hypothetical protein PC123_g11244 [Phytophthora cactorum]|nr:hypothetical protein PC123_g11244 [Phytophthora cactorum]
MALSNGFPRRLEGHLRVAVLKYDVWRLNLGKTPPPANVAPLRIRLKEGDRAVKSKPRQCTPAVRTFIREFNAKLVELGWVYENSGSRWASPVLPVRKHDESGDEYRLVNDAIEALISTMSHMSALLEHMKGE